MTITAPALADPVANANADDAANAADQPAAVAAYVAFMNELIQAAERADADMREKKAAADYAMTPNADTSSEALFTAISAWAHARGYAAGVSEICRIVERHRVIAIGEDEGEGEGKGTQWRAPSIAPPVFASAPAPMSRAEKRRWEKRKSKRRRR